MLVLTLHHPDDGDQEQLFKTETMRLCLEKYSTTLRNRLFDIKMYRLYLCWYEAGFGHNSWFS